jgi:hypothetical protein
MRIHEILFWNDDPAKGDRADPHLDFPPRPFSNDLTNLASAFTRRGLVKHFWNFDRIERQPSEPAPPDAGSELIPSGTLEPTTASWQAERVETEPSAGQHRLVPFRRYRGGSGG